MPLLVRRERKYLLPRRGLPGLLNCLAGRFQIMEVAGCLQQSYANCYWDSPTFDCYRAHHRGARRRHKIRLRHYLETGTAFWEVKERIKPGLTHKHRWPQGEDGWRDYVRNHQAQDPADLIPVLENQFRRITLIDLEGGRRLTFDLAISGTIPGSRKRIDFDLVVAEYKQPPGSPPDRDFENLGGRFGLRPSPFSKYCLACCSLYPRLPHNAFKPLFRTLERLQAP